MRCVDEGRRACFSVSCGTGLVTQLGHAGYLGEELAKAQTALHFGLRYDQDRPLRAREIVEAKPASASVSEGPPKIEPVKVYTLKQLEDIVPGHLVDLFFTAKTVPKTGLLEGEFVDMDESGAARVYTRTSQHLQVEWNDAGKLIVGGKEDLVVGAIL